MARDERKRQKQLERKKAKRHEALARKATETSDGLPRDPERIAALPITECWLTESLFERGMGQALIVRRLPTGHLAVGCFLLDTFCLGVKNAFCRTMTESEYRQLLRTSQQSTRIEKSGPAFIAKLVLGLETWARAIGFEPHPDYAAAKRILNGINPQECTETFTFGKDGKPYFMNGPYDKPFRINQIISTLTRTCGQGNFHYVLQGDAVPRILAPA